MNNGCFLVKSVHTAVPAHGFTIAAKVDIDGACRDIPYTNEYKVQGPGYVRLLMQERHAKGRLTLNISSNHDKDILMHVVTSTPDVLPRSHVMRLGCSNTLSWQICEEMGTRITFRTHWEVWSAKPLDGTKDLHLFSITMTKAANNQDDMRIESGYQSASSIEDYDDDGRGMNDTESDIDD